MDYEKKYNELIERVKEFHETGNALTKARMEIILPELADSENEKIRKEMIDYFSQFKEDGIRGVDITPWISYLEKQKEQKPESCDCSRDEESYTNGIHHVLMNPEAYGLIKQKPAGWRDTDMNEARNNLISVCRDWERGEKTTLLPVVAVRARYFLEHLTEPQQPAEWSEEDKECRNELIQYIEQRIGDGTTGQSLWRKWHSWLKSLPERLNLQPKQEWNEEDKEMLFFLNEFMDNKGKDYFSTLVYPKIKIWLKSLQPHWKPSEEQMKIFNEAIEHYSKYWDSEDIKILCSLYDDLKKL